MKDIKITIILFAIVIILTSVLIFNKPAGKKHYFRVSNTLIDNMKITDVHSYNNFQYLIEGEYQGNKINTYIHPNVSVNQAEDIVHDNNYMIESLYRDFYSPYPGRLSNKQTCEDEFKPKRISNSPFDYFLLYSTKRYTYGACSWDLISHRAIIYYYLCGNELYQMEIFLPLNSDTSGYEKILNESKCNA